MIFFGAAMVWYIEESPRQYGHSVTPCAVIEFRSYENTDK